MTAISLKEAIDHLASPIMGRKQILPIAAARRIRRAWGTNPLTTVYELVTQLLEEAAARKKHDTERTRFRENEGGGRFWRAVAREVGWAEDLTSSDLILFTNLCARHYLRAKPSAVDRDDERVKNMMDTAKKWCDLLLPDELRSMIGQPRRLNIKNMDEIYRESEKYESAGVCVAAGAGGDSSSDEGSNEFWESCTDIKPISTSSDNDDDDDDDDNEEDSGEDTFVSEREAARLRRLSNARWSALNRFSGDTVVEKTDQPQPRRSRFREHFD